MQGSGRSSLHKAGGCLKGKNKSDRQTGSGIPARPLSPLELQIKTFSANVSHPSSRQTERAVPHMLLASGPLHILDFLPRGPFLSYPCAELSFRIHSNRSSVTALLALSMEHTVPVPVRHSSWIGRASWCVCGGQILRR